MDDVWFKETIKLFLVSLIFSILSVILTIKTENISFLYIHFFIFFFLFTSMVNKRYIKELTKYSIWFLIRFFLVCILNKPIFILLIFLPEIISLALFFIKLGAISLAAFSGSLIFFLAAYSRNGIIYLLSIMNLIFVSIVILVALPYFLQKAYEKMPKFVQEYLFYLSKLFGIYFLIPKIKKIVKEELIDVSCWIQYFVVLISTFVNNILIWGSNVILSIIVTVITIILFIVVGFYIYYLRKKKLNLLRFGREIFISWTEEFGKLSEIALDLYLKVTRGEIREYFILLLVTNKNFLKAVVLSNFLILILAILDIWWALFTQLDKIILQYLPEISQIYYIVCALGIIYLAYTYSSEFLRALRKFNKYIRLLPEDLLERMKI